MAQFNVTMPATNTSDPVALRRYIGKLVEELRYTLANLDDSNISRAGISIQKVQGIQAEFAKIAQAEIGKAKIGYAQIQHLEAQVAKIVTAVIETAVIDWAQIEELHAAIIQALHAEIKVGEFDLAEVKNLLSEALALEQGTAGSMYITNLAVTSANLLSAMLGKLVLKGEDGKYYQVMIGADGTIQTQEVQPSQGEIEAGETESGLGIVETTANFANLTAQNIKGNEAIFQTILAQSMTAGKLTAGEALIASATIPTLYATSIQAMGNSLDLSANQSITTLVGGKANAADVAGSVGALEEMISQAGSELDGLEQALAGKAGEEMFVQLSTELKQTSQSITAIISQVAGLEGASDAADALLAQYQLFFRMDASGVTIGKSNSDFDVRIDNTKLSFRENGQEIAYVSNSQLYITAAEVTQKLTIGNYSFTRLSDGSLALVR